LKDKRQEKKGEYLDPRGLRGHKANKSDVEQNKTIRSTRYDPE
jgi:hypothetical protein